MALTARACGMLVSEMRQEKRLTTQFALISRIVARIESYSIVR